MCFRTQITQKTYSKNNDFFFVFSEKIGSSDGLGHFLGGSEKKYNKKIYV